MSRRAVALCVTARRRCCSVKTAASALAALRPPGSTDQRFAGELPSQLAPSLSCSARFEPGKHSKKVARAKAVTDLHREVTLYQNLGRSVLKILPVLTAYQILGRSVLEICGFFSEFGPSPDILVGRQISERAMRPVT